MRVSSLIGFNILIFLNMQSTLGYWEIPVYGRNFVDPFNIKSSIASLTTRVSALESAISPFSGLFQSWINKLISLQAQIDILQAKLQTPKCAADIAASGGKVIGTKCYTFSSTALSYTAATTDCQNKGGILAEPKPVTVADNKKFYDSVKAKFDPGFSTSVSSDGFYVGIERAATVTAFSFASNGDSIATNDVTAVFTKGTGQALTAAAAANAPEAAVLQSSGTYKNDLQDATHYYVCQFSAY